MRKKTRERRVHEKSKKATAQNKGNLLNLWDAEICKLNSLITC